MVKYHVARVPHNGTEMYYFRVQWIVRRAHTSVISSARKNKRTKYWKFYENDDVFSDNLRAFPTRDYRRPSTIRVHFTAHYVGERYILLKTRDELTNPSSDPSYRWLTTIYSPTPSTRFTLTVQRRCMIMGRKSFIAERTAVRIIPWHVSLMWNLSNFLIRP